MRSDVPSSVALRSVIFLHNAATVADYLTVFFLLRMYDSHFVPTGYASTDTKGNSVTQPA